MQAPAGAITPPGPFEGYLVTGLGGLYYTQQNFISIVHVKGSGGNPFGHSLLWLGPGIGFVQSVQPGFHQARYLPSEDWTNYCTAMGKPTNPLAVVPLGGLINDMIGFRNEVDNVLGVGFKWTPWHDCSTMVDQCLRAGGVPEKHLSKNVLPTVSVLKLKLKKKFGNPTIAPLFGAFPGGNP